MRSAAALALCLLPLGNAGASDAMSVATFSASRAGSALPDGWVPARVRGVDRLTHYALVEDSGTVVLRADANASASAVTRKLRADPAVHPVLRWKWKVGNLLKAGNIAAKSGDDYPARLYVMFDYPLERLPIAERAKLRIARALHDPDLPAATLCYVWDARAPAGTIAPSPYSDRVRLIVVESGPARLNRWAAYERDLAADFRAAFGEEPPAVAAVAVAVDTDNTGEAATTWFGDISLHKRAVTP